MAQLTCPLTAGAFLVNSSCVCPPGLYLSKNTCIDFVPTVKGREVSETSDFYFVPKFDTSLTTSSDTNKGQTFFLILTGVLLGIWLFGTFYLRFTPLRGYYFLLRRYVSLVDYAFSKKHWIDEQKVQVKRKTELGGMLSISAFIFIIGVILGLIYQFAAQKNVTVQSIVPANGREVESFSNDIDYNITFISAMKCSQFLVNTNIEVGSTVVDQRQINGSDFISVKCLDGNEGPTVNLFCPECVIGYDNYINNFTFVDRPDLGLIATAVGFSFNAVITGRINHGGKTKTRQSVVNGKLQAGSNGSFATPATLRGGQPSVLVFRFIPRLFKQNHNLRLLQATFHEFVSGTSHISKSGLQAQTSNTSAGVTVLLDTEILSAYIVQTQVEASIGILTFLSKVGGIYQLGILIFFTALNMSERYIKFLRYDDKLLNRLERQRVARYHWRKLRIAVKYGGFLNARQDGADNGNASASTAILQPPKSPFMRATSMSLKRLESSIERKPPVPPPGAPLPGAAKKPGGRHGNLFGRMFARKMDPKFSNPNISESMERKARVELQQEYPGQALPPVILESVQVDPSSAPSNNAAGGKSSNPFDSAIGVLGQGVHQIGHGVKEGFKATGSVATKLGENLAQLGKTNSRSASTESPGEAHVPPPGLPRDKSLHKSNSITNVVIKKKKKPMSRDTRLGSSSDHKGSYVRKNRRPSWIPGYSEMPAVPVPESEEDRKARIEKEHRKEEKKLKREEQQLSAVPENSPPPADDSDDDDDEDDEGDKDDTHKRGDDKVDPIDLHNYLVDLHEYQTRLRSDFLAAQSMLENLVQRFRPHSDL